MTDQLGNISAGHVERGEDFWVASGHHLVDRGDGGGLVVTDALIRAYLARPELMPPPEACPVERTLHARLLDSPRTLIAGTDVALVADADARENFAVFLAFRDHLLAHPTLEAAYRALFRKDAQGVPPLFIQQLCHIIARNAFDDCVDTQVLRAAECFFRPQRLSLHEGALLLADLEVIERHEHDRHHSPLLSMLGGPAVTALTVLKDDIAGEYKKRSDAYDFVFDLSHPTRGRHALAEAASIWMRHLLDIPLALTPVDRLDREPFAWFMGFDAEGTAIGNRVWQHGTLSDEETARILALFTFTLPAHPRLDATYSGRRGFAILGSSADGVVRIKPQNFIMALPFARDQA